MFGQNWPIISGFKKAFNTLMIVQEVIKGYSSLRKCIKSSKHITSKSARNWEKASWLSYDFGQNWLKINSSKKSFNTLGTVQGSIAGCNLKMHKIPEKCSSLN